MALSVAPGVELRGLDEAGARKGLKTLICDSRPKTQLQMIQQNASAKSTVRSSL